MEQRRRRYVFQMKFYGFLLLVLGEHSDQIDRFDVRAHLDSVPAEKKGDNDIDAEFEKDELSEVMYERYREIIHNDFRGLGKRPKTNIMYLVNTCFIA